MNPSDRRRFLEQSAALLSALALEGCLPRDSPGAAETLEAVGGVVLPRRELGDAGVARVVEGFRKWLEELEPGAELDHPYIWTDEILYGPPDPEPTWSDQLRALEEAAERRHGRSFSRLGHDEREPLLREQLAEVEKRDEAGLPDAAVAAHVALGLLAYFYSTPEANDLCYQARIERHSCRGLDSAPDAPRKA